RAGRTITTDSSRSSSGSSTPGSSAAGASAEPLEKVFEPALDLLLIDPAQDARWDDPDRWRCCGARHLRAHFAAAVVHGHVEVHGAEIGRASLREGGW